MTHQSTKEAGKWWIATRHSITDYEMEHFTQGTALQKNKIYDIYIDESGQTKHRYLTLGALILPSEVVEDYDSSLRLARVSQLPYGEIKWTKVSAAKLPAYTRVVEVALSQNFTRRGVEFHCVVVDTSKIRDSIYNHGSREIGFNKEIYQLAMKCFRLHKNGLFHVYLDRRETPFPTQKLRDILNFGAMKKSPSADWPFRRLHFRESHDCMMIQTVDVLLGSISFHLNGHRTAPSASAAKGALSDLVLKLGGVRDVTVDTQLSGHFTIWHRQLRQGEIQ